MRNLKFHACGTSKNTKTQKQIIRYSLNCELFWDTGSCSMRLRELAKLNITGVWRSYNLARKHIIDISLLACMHKSNLHILLGHNKGCVCLHETTPVSSISANTRKTVNLCHPCQYMAVKATETISLLIINSVILKKLRVDVHTSVWWKYDRQRVRCCTLSQLRTKF